MTKLKPFREMTDDTTPIVSAFVFNGRLLVATQESLFEVTDGKLIELLFEKVEP